MKPLIAAIVFLILVGVGLGSFASFFEGLGWNWATYSNLLPGGLGIAFIVLTIAGGYLFLSSRGNRDE